jgi:putative salt-induced outer membrane protein
MRRLTTLIPMTGLALAAAGSATAASVPRAVRAMIDKAAQSDDPTVFAAVIAVAKQANPGSAGEIDALGKAAADRAAARRLAATAAASTPPVRPKPVAAPPTPVQWKGTAELGGSHATGVSEVLALYGSLDVSRVGPVWTHRLTVRDDFQRTDGLTTTERFAAAYEPRVQIAPAMYGFGLTQYEHDRSLGYRNRYTLGAGVGVKLIDRPNLTVGGDIGPALRFTEYYALDREQTIAGRASLNIRWVPSQRITIAQEAAAYVEGQQSSARSVTSVETLLFGPLKARLSYNLQYERDSRISRSDLDTITRASILYSF